MGARPVVALMASALMLAACSTPYAPSGITGGYADRELVSGIWRVGFSGNGHTTYETVQTYWLYRCAEVTLENGFDGFEILPNMTLSQRAAPADRPVRLAAHGGPIFVPIYAGPAPYKPQIVGDIRLLKEPFDPVPGKVFNAAALENVLEPYVNGEKCRLGNVCAHAHDYLYPPERTADQPE